jgi:hypothetical protein
MYISHVHWCKLLSEIEILLMSNNNILRRGSGPAKAINVKDLTSEPGATAKLSDFRDHTDPKYIGPGTWDLLHRQAFQARTHDKQISTIAFIKDVCYGFPCKVCKGHSTEYIKNHPLEEYLDILVDIGGQRILLGIFVWTWKFHNAVNARLKKPIMSWDTVYNLYSDSDTLICSKSCLEADDSTPESLTQPIQSIPPISSTQPIQPKQSIQPIQPISSTQSTSNSIPKIPEFQVAYPNAFRMISMQR